MFDFSWSELLLIGVVALVFIGPKELPGVLRMAGQWMAKVRRMASEFQSQFQDAMREAELAELKKEVDEMTSQASRFDPFSETRREMDKTQREIETALAGTPAANTEASREATAVEGPASEPATLASPAQSEGEAQVGDAAPTSPESTTPAPTAEPKAGAESAGSGGEHR
jgi:sec-independent protein translocase protein TatB